MREILPVVSDDLDWTEGKTRVPAGNVVSFGFMADWYELDLSDEHLLELKNLAARYIKAGRLTDRPRGKPGRKTGADNWRERYRKWHFAAFGAEVEKRPGNGGYRYVRERVDRFKAWETEHGPYDGDIGRVRGDSVGSDQPERRRADAGDSLRES